MSKLASTNWRNDWTTVNDDEASIREVTPTHQSSSPVLSAEQSGTGRGPTDQGYVQTGDSGVASARKNFGGCGPSRAHENAIICGMSAANLAKHEIGLGELGELARCVDDVRQRFHGDRQPPLEAISLSISEAVFEIGTGCLDDFVLIAATVPHLVQRITTPSLSVTARFCLAVAELAYQRILS